MFVLVGYRDIWDFINVKNSNISYVLKFYFSLVLSSHAFLDIVEKRSSSSLTGMTFSGEAKSSTPLGQMGNCEKKGGDF